MKCFGAKLYAGDGRERKRKGKEMRDLLRNINPPPPLDSSCGFLSTGGPSLGAATPRLARRAVILLDIVRGDVCPASVALRGVSEAALCGFSPIVEPGFHGREL